MHKNSVNSRNSRLFYRFSYNYDKPLCSCWYSTYFNSCIKENRFIFEKQIYLDEEFANKNNSRRHKVGDVITVHTGDVGTSAIIGKDLDGSLGFATIVSRIKNLKQINPQRSVSICSLTKSKM